MIHRLACKGLCWLDWFWGVWYQEKLHKEAERVARLLFPVNGECMFMVVIAFVRVFVTKHLQPKQALQLQAFQNASWLLETWPSDFSD